MRINTFKTLNSGRVLIETKSKDEMEALEKDIQANCGDELEINVHTLRQHRLTYVFFKNTLFTACSITSCSTIYYVITM